MSRTARQALGYRELIAHLEGRTTEAEAVEQAISRTRQFARRQERWYRRDPRIDWFDVSDPGRLAALADQLADEVIARLEGQRST